MCCETARVEPGGLEQQRGDEQEGAGEEEAGGLVGEQRCGGEKKGEAGRVPLGRRMQACPTCEGHRRAGRGG